FLLCSGLSYVLCQLEADDECREGACALHALQTRSLVRSEARSDEPSDEVKTSPYVRPKNHLDLHPNKFPISSSCKKPPCSGQIHLQLGGPGEMVVSFVSQPESDTKSRVRFGKGDLDVMDQEAIGQAEVYSQLIYWRADLWNPPLKGGYGLPQDIVAKDMSTTSWASDERTGWKYPGTWKEVGTQQVESDHLGWYKNPGERYDSPAIHTVVLADLQPGQTYKYQVENDDRIFEFTMPAEEAKYPYHVGLVGDVGQTPVSNSSMHLLSGLNPEVVLMTGDLAYADGYYPRWDSFGIMFETLAAKIPVMSCVGNHEYGEGESFKSYNARYPMPHAQSGSMDNTYWSRDIGPMHVIALNTYSQTKPGSYQYKWLEKDLKSFSRKKTPWLVVIMHAPWYNSNLGHYGEAKVTHGDAPECFSLLVVLCSQALGVGLHKH
ncbi:PAP21, partial [Symbiodinium natans]